MKHSKINWDKQLNNFLAEWVISEHFERFERATVKEVAEAYIGVYSNRPTSWLAFLARNNNVERTKVISMEADPELVRIPGMRRSKFLLPQSLAATVFGATRLPLVNHEWRLRDVGLTLADYRKILSELTEFTISAPVRLKDIGNAFGLTGPQARAYVSVATYDGVLIRIPPPNIWSNRWLYAAPPNGLLQSNDTLLTSEWLLQDIAARYIKHYGPVTIDDLAWWLSISKERSRLLMESSMACEIGNGVWISITRQELFEQCISKTAQNLNTDVRFLPAWDPLVMGYAPGSRQRICLGLDKIRGYDAAGNGLPVVLMGARAVATWGMKVNGSKRSIQIDLSNVAGKEQEAIQGAAFIWANRIGAFYDPSNNNK
ncbi:DNA glycosylase AlkZ-like family protein [Xenorhabdus sp. Sc-CR9]|uniref:DNA glycosylase AlkZ-like family protein n=1 Tax=Xenorhabdus sp. Sc-CR9 TaxID=2584468 RepID=UPI001F44AA74|nr:crosslink repair DNA glycosylase YcaQ family protein [Xenorhabdus sp. Sc-CR9]